MPKAANARCSAAVPLVVAIPYFIPHHEENKLSNSVINLPAEEIQFVVMHSLRFSSSCSPNHGFAIGIKSASDFISAILSPFHDINFLRIIRSIPWEYILFKISLPPVQISIYHYLNKLFK